MKKRNIILLFSAALAIATMGYAGTVNPPYEVATWPGFRSAAVSYTFDDGTSNQFAVAIPMFNEFDFDMTLFTVTNWSPNWTALQNAAAQGHEVASHTVTHANLSGLTIAQQTTELANSQAVINSHIPGNQCITIAYPYCVPGDQSLCEQYYIAARHCQGYIEPSTPANFYQISSIICGSQGSVKTLADFTAKFTSTASSHGWCVFLLHGIDNDGGYSPLSSSILRDSLEYLDANRGTFWVSTFGNAVRYIRERNDVSVTEVSAEATQITVQAADTLDNTVYNYPVTIRRPLPEGWTWAKVSQNSQPAETKITEVASITYVMFTAVPDGGDIVITKVPAAPAGLTASAGQAIVVLDWNDNAESDLAGYNVYRSATSGSGYNKLNSSLLSSSNYEDGTVSHDTAYYYVVTAVDTNANESGNSNEVFGGLYGDFTGNNTVSLNDLSVFLSYWLASGSSETAGVDLDENQLVNFSEFSVLAGNWLLTP